MICEKCKGKMNWSIEGATHGWRCPMCGWNIITTYIEDIDRDETEYSLYIKNVTEVDAERLDAPSASSVFFRETSSSLPSYVTLSPSDRLVLVTTS